MEAHASSVGIVGVFVGLDDITLELVFNSSSPPLADIVLFGFSLSGFPRSF